MGKRRTLPEKIRESAAMNKSRQRIGPARTFSLHGKVVLLTGATDGIGKAAALKMARMGARLYLVGRNTIKTREAILEIKSASGNSEVFALFGDLSATGDVTRIAQQFLATGDPLHVLVNNAAVFGFRERTVGADGHEINFSVNYLAIYMLTTLLLGRLQETPNARILNIASEAYTQSDFELHDFNAQHEYHHLRQYGFSKLCALIFSNELARRLRGTSVSVNCMHPGLVYTNISKHSGPLYKILLKLFCLVFARPIGDASDDYLYLCFSEALNGISGQYFYYVTPKQLDAIAYDTDHARALLELSNRITGLSIPV